MKPFLLVILPFLCLSYFLCQHDLEGSLWSLSGFIVGVVIFIATKGYRCP